MRILKTHPLLNLFNSYLVDSPQPSNISYLWNFGSLLATCLIVQIITGVILAMHYSAGSMEGAFLSVEHIMRDVNYGWFLRYAHANGASFFFLFVYMHMGRGLYYGSYREPRTMVWNVGVIIFLLLIIIAFLGYVLPMGNMSLWGATVITNLVSAIPWIGTDIVELLWGGFSVNNATINRFFSLHYLLPFVLAAFALIHMIFLHTHGSGNPLGITGNADRVSIHPYYTFKDLITIFLYFILLGSLVFYAPNLLGESINYEMANPLKTPPAIVPEWYLLPFYAILRSIPNKLLGVIAMLAAILILFILPFVDNSRIRGIQFRPLSKLAFWSFLAVFLLLTILGAKHVEAPYIVLGQYLTAMYFLYFLLVIPLITTLENVLAEIATNSNK